MRSGRKWKVKPTDNNSKAENERGIRIAQTEECVTLEIPGRNCDMNWRGFSTYAFYALGNLLILAVALGGGWQVLLLMGGFWNLIFSLVIVTLLWRWRGWEVLRVYDDRLERERKLLGVSMKDEYYFLSMLRLRRNDEPEPVFLLWGPRRGVSRNDLLGRRKILFEYLGSTVGLGRALNKDEVDAVLGCIQQRKKRFDGQRQ